MKRATMTACPDDSPMVMRPSSVTLAISLSFELNEASAVTSRTVSSE
jgi:hypothetical protein